MSQPVAYEGEVEFYTSDPPSPGFCIAVASAESPGDLVGRTISVQGRTFKVTSASRGQCGAHPDVSRWLHLRAAELPGATAIAR